MIPAKNSDVVRLIERLEGDEAFRNSLVEISDSTLIPAHLKEAGYQFTDEELQATLDILREEKAAELSDSLMEEVVGGANILSQLKDEVVRDYQRCQVTNSKVVNHVIWSITMPGRIMAGNVS